MNLHEKFTFCSLFCEKLFHRSKHVSICYSIFVCHVPTERNNTSFKLYFSSNYEQFWKWIVIIMTIITRRRRRKRAHTQQIWVIYNNRTFISTNCWFITCSCSKLFVIVLHHTFQCILLFIWKKSIERINKFSF